jgi:hypothetical protein
MRGSDMNVLHKKVAIAVNTWQEPYKQLAVCFRKIAAAFPSAHVKVFVNGGARPDVTAMAKSFNFDAVDVPNLGSNATWKLWWLRMLKFFEAVNADVCFKFDPDTMVDATPGSFPDADYFGSRVRCAPTASAAWFVQGGVTGLSGRAVRRLIESDVLRSGGGKSWEPRFALNAPFLDDQLVCTALAVLGIDPVTWDQCLSRWKCPVLNCPITHAIVHPRYYGTGNLQVVESFAGQWRGMLPDRSLRIGLTVCNSEGESQAIIVGQDLGKKTRCEPADWINSDGSILTLRISPLQCMFQLRLTPDQDKLQGSLSVREREYPIELLRVLEISTLAEPDGLLDVGGLSSDAGSGNVSTPRTSFT